METNLGIGRNSTYQSESLKKRTDQQFEFLEQKIIGGFFVTPIMWGMVELNPIWRTIFFQNGGRGDKTRILCSSECICWKGNLSQKLASSDPQRTCELDLRCWMMIIWSELMGNSNHGQTTMGWNLGNKTVWKKFIGLRTTKLQWLFVFCSGFVWHEKIQWYAKITRKKEREKKQDEFEDIVPNRSRSGFLGLCSFLASTLCRSGRMGFIRCLLVLFCKRL